MFDYTDSQREAMLRQERRQALRNMKDDARMNAMRDPSWRAAALETDPSLSGLSPSYAKALHDETLAAKFPNELAGISEGRQAVAVLGTVLEGVSKAIEHELRVTSGTVAAAPAQAAPWIQED